MRTERRMGLDRGGLLRRMYTGCGLSRGMRTIAALVILAVGAFSLPPVPALAQEYTARIGDVLDIVVVGEPDFSRTVVVSQEGSIFLPLVGNIGVQGLTIQQITSK